MKYDAWIGVDPGKSGAIVVMYADNRIETFPMILAGKNMDLGTISNWIYDMLDNCGNPIVCIEKVHSMPGQGVSSTFSFGYSTGAIHGIFAAMNIARVVVTPQRWKKIILADTTRTKEATVEYCRSRYPEVSLLLSKKHRKPHLGIADALCIAEYCMRMHSWQKE